MENKFWWIRLIKLARISGLFLRNLRLLLFTQDKSEFKVAQIQLS